MLMDDELIPNALAIDETDRTANTDESHIATGHISQPILNFNYPPHKPESTSKLAGQEYEVSVQSEITESPGHQKKLSKVPLQLVVHPRSKKWVFEKAQEHKIVNRQLKFRYKMHKSQDRTQETQTSESHLATLITNAQTRTEANNVNYLQSILEHTPVFKEESNLKTRYKKMYNKSSSKFRSFAKAYIHTTEESPERPKLVLREKSTPNVPKALNLTRSPSNPSKSPFHGRLEPITTIQARPKFIPKAPELAIVKEPHGQLRVTTTSTFGMSTTTGSIKPTFFVNMNKVVLADSEGPDNNRSFEKRGRGSRRIAPVKYKQSKTRQNTDRDSSPIHNLSGIITENTPAKNKNNSYTKLKKNPNLNMDLLGMLYKVDNISLIPRSNLNNLAGRKAMFYKNG